MTIWSAEVSPSDLITRVHPLDGYEEVRFAKIKVWWCRVLRTLGAI